MLPPRSVLLFAGIHLFACIGIVTRAAGAQSAPELLARGDSLTEALRPEQALEQFRAAFFVADSANSHAVLWRFARAQIDVAKQLEGNEHKQQRDSMYATARQYAEAAIRTDSLDAEGHFLLANALGRLSRSRGGRERVQFAKEIYTAAATALDLDPTHAGAHHVIGAWHAEIKRLSGMTRFFAKTFLGAGFMNRASLDSAVTHLGRAVELEPEYIYHRLELAEIYVDLERYADARQELERIADLPPTGDVLDPTHKTEAARLLGEVRSRTGS